MNQIQTPAPGSPEFRALVAQKLFPALRSGMTLAVWAELLPNGAAIFGAHGNRTWSELNAHANQLVRALRARGLREGDGVALYCSNRAEYVESTNAARRAGFRLTPVNWHLTGQEAGYVVNDCDAKAFIAEARLRDERFGEAAVTAANAAPGATVRLAVGGALPGFESYDAALAAEAGNDIENPTAGTQMLYTSGTTGRPKGVFRQSAPPAAPGQGPGASALRPAPGGSANGRPASPAGRAATLPSSSTPRARPAGPRA